MVVVAIMLLSLIPVAMSCFFYSWYDDYSYKKRLKLRKNARLRKALDNPEIEFFKRDYSEEAVKYWN